MPFPDFTPTTPVFARSVAEKHGEREMIVLDERRLGYREAEAQSARLARGLLAEGVGKGTRVGVWMPNGPDLVVAWLATTRIGAVLVPINTFYQPRELGWILRHADVQVLLAVPRFLGHDFLARLEAAVPGLAEAGAEPYRLPALPMLRRVLADGAHDPHARGARRWVHDAARLAARADEDAALGEQSAREARRLRFGPAIA